MTNESNFFYPSQSDRDDFIGWLKFILKNKAHAADWAGHLITAQDWSATRRVEVPKQKTESGNPEFYTF